MGTFSHGCKKGVRSATRWSNELDTDEDAVSAALVVVEYHFAERNGDGSPGEFGVTEGSPIPHAFGGRV